MRVGRRPGNRATMGFCRGTRTELEALGANLLIYPDIILDFRFLFEGYGIMPVSVAFYVYLDTKMEIYP